MNFDFCRRAIVRPVLTCVVAAATLQAAEFHVAPDGSDQFAGTFGQPFATLERARDAVRKLKQDGQAGVGITVYLHGGDYVRTNALELTALDSGTASQPIVWRAYKSESVRLLGGIEQRDFRNFQGVSDPAIRSRLPESARSNVIQLDLRNLGLTNLGKLVSRGFGRPLAPSHSELFFNGRPMTLARWPNEGGFERIAGFPESGAQNDEHGGRLGKLEDGFLYAGERPRNWKITDDIWVHGYWAWDWANSYELVASLDLERHLVRTAPPRGLYGFRKGQRFYFLNVLEELDQPGEYYVDRASGELYFWPPGPVNVPNPLPRLPLDKWPAPDRARLRGILLSVLEQPLLRLTDVSHVTFSGLILEATRSSAVEIRGGASNRIAGCVVRNVGNYGMVIDGRIGHGVQSCDVFDTGDGGVQLRGGDRQTLSAGGHFVDNCHFARQGRWSKCYVPAVLMEGVGLRASHNLIQDHPHCAILFSGNDHLIEFNEIHHIALETGDVGAIYAGRDYSYRGNRIRCNFIHDTGGVGMGSMGVYMDDCVSGTEIYGNVFYKVQRAAFLGGGRDHRVINNIFVDCNHAVELDGRGLDTSPVWRNMVDQTMRQRLAEVPLSLYRERYPTMTNLDEYYGKPGGPSLHGAAFKGVPPGNEVVARNICVGKWLNVYWHATPDMIRLENNLTNAVRSFVKSPGQQVKATDFELKGDSPARGLGFEEIPLEKIGLYRNELREL